MQTLVHGSGMKYDFHVVPIPAMQQFPLSPALS